MNADPTATDRRTRAGDGLDCFLRGARIMREKSLRPFVWGPVAVGLALVVALLAVGYTLVQDAVAWIGEALPSWLGWLASGLAPLLCIIGVVVAGWLFGFLAVIFASPFAGHRALGDLPG